MRTIDDIETFHDRTGKARMFSYFAKAIAAVNSLPEAAEHFRNSLPAHYKAAVPAGTYDDVTPSAAYGREFLKLSERQRIVPRLLGSVALPPNLPTPLLDVIGTARFTQEGASHPAYLYNQNLVTGSPTTMGMDLAITNDLARTRQERGVTHVERIMSRVLTRGENSVFLSDDARVAGYTPGGILNGVSPLVGGSPAEAAADFSFLFDQVASGQPERPYVILSRRGALYLRTLADSNAGSIFRNVDVMNGGDIAGVPVLIAPEAGSKLVLLDAALIGICDEGLSVRRSFEASIQMSDTPTNNSASGTGAQLVSAFQTNSVLLRLVRYVDWVKATSDAVQYLELPISGSPA